VAGDAAHSDLMDDVNTSWTRVEGAEKIQPLVSGLIKDYSLSNPEKSVPSLVILYQELRKLKNGYWRNQKLKEVEDLNADCMGLWLEATVHNEYVVQGQSMDVTFSMIDMLKAHTVVNEIVLDKLDTICRQELTEDKNYSFSKKVMVDRDKPISQPYWLAQEMAPGSFNVKDQNLIGDPQSKPSFEVQFHVTVEGQEFVFFRPVQYRYTDPVRGDLYEPLTVLPPFTGSIDPSLMVFTTDEKKDFFVHTENHVPGSVTPALSLSNTAQLKISAPASQSGPTLSYSAKPLTGQTMAFFADLQYTLNGKMDTAKELRTINYQHIPRIDYFRNARAKFVIADIKTAGKRIGYIEGAGDKVPDCLFQMGYDVVMLKEKDISAGFLSQFDAIITGIRAYDVHDWLFGKYEILMDYVKSGGNLIVQYSQSNRIGMENGKISPFHFSITRNRVTDEEAKVNFLIPDHPVLNFPNRITENDFDGWIQERGIYFAGNVDDNFQSIFAMNDPGESPQKGSLIIGDYGKGKFVYTGLVFFRELPAGVPGAYKLFANIIALNHKKGF
jgi:hypothetical protein